MTYLPTYPTKEDLSKIKQTALYKRYSADAREVGVPVVEAHAKGEVKKQETEKSPSLDMAVALVNQVLQGLMFDQETESEKESEPHIVCIEKVAQPAPGLESIHAFKLDSAAYHVCQNIHAPVIPRIANALEIATEDSFIIPYEGVHGQTVNLVNATMILDVVSLSVPSHGFFSAFTRTQHPDQREFHGTVCVPCPCVKLKMD